MSLQFVRYSGTKGVVLQCSIHGEIKALKSAFQENKHICKKCEKLKEYQKIIGIRYTVIDMKQGSLLLNCCDHGEFNYKLSNIDNYDINIKYCPACRLIDVYPHYVFNKIENGVNATGICSIHNECIAKKWPFNIKYESCSKCEYDKKKITNIEKYGVENQAQSDVVKEKYKTTCEEKYGVSSHLASKEIKDKIERTNIQKYGVKRPLQNDIILNKFTDTMMKRYGVEHAVHYEEFVENTKSLMLERYGNEHFFKSDKFINEKTYQKRSTGEIELGEFLDDLNIKYEICNRTILEGLELDFYLPDFNVAIEFHGVYFHSENCLGVDKAKYKHLTKLNACEARNIQLIQIWEDQWIYKKDIVKNILLYKLKLNKNQYQARKCEVFSIGTEEYAEFLNKNHIQGSCKSAIKLGLKLNGIIISVIGFSKCPSNVKKYGDPSDVYELDRFSSLGVAGAFTKLLSHFVRNYIPRLIYSFGDRELVNIYSNVYVNNGFNLLEIQNPDYKYFGSKIRQHKFNFRKEYFKELGLEIDGKTEGDLATELGLLKCWDSGKLLYIFECA